MWIRGVAIYRHLLLKTEIVLSPPSPVAATALLLAWSLLVSEAASSSRLDSLSILALLWARSWHVIIIEKLL